MLPLLAGMILMERCMRYTPQVSSSEIVSLANSPMTLAGKIFAGIVTDMHSFVGTVGAFGELSQPSILAAAKRASLLSRLLAKRTLTTGTFQALCLSEL